ncbi:MAG TPA: hypothetical protein VJZ71_20750 [Phycisphaerae bacterium]|nr:hypothetical protein [Phycisphaerae bacterium]
MVFMKIELTPGQQEQLDRADELPVSVCDPRDQSDYVLVPAEQYEQMLEVIEDDVEQRALRRAGAKTLAKRLADESA